MELEKVIKAMGFEVRAGSQDLDKQVTGGYVSDLLSDVIANSRKGDLWITLQIHQNIVAVATLKELAGIVVIGGKEPAEETLKKADEENIPIMTSPLLAFETAGKLYELGISGSR